MYKNEIGRALKSNIFSNEKNKKQISRNYKPIIILPNEKQNYESSFSQFSKNDIISFSGKLIEDEQKNHGSISLEEVAYKIGSRFSLASVRFTETSEGSLVLSYQKRMGIFKISLNNEKKEEKNKFWYLSQNGIIFPEMSEENFLSTSLPTLGGILSERDLKGFAFKPQEKFSKLLHEATALKVELDKVFLEKEEKKRFELLHIEYIPYRGFEFVLKEDKKNELKVFIGHKPFDLKIMRLSDMIFNQNIKNSPISAIELDYSGKIFVQYKDQNKTDKSDQGSSL